MPYRFASAFFLGMALGCVSGWEATTQGWLVLVLCTLLNLTVAGFCHHEANRREEPPWEK